MTDEDPLSREEIEVMQEAEKDRKEGNLDAFTSLDEVEKELGIG